jgi:hypothetical protein
VDPRDFQTSAAYMGAISRALAKLGQLENVIAQAESGAAHMLRAPNSQSWWSSSDAFAMTRAIAKVGGADLVQQVGKLGVLESISAIVRPLVGVLLAISGPSPSTLLSRFGQLSSTAVKNVKFTWLTTGPTSGELTITYPVTVPPEYVAYWTGAFDFVWETTKKSGTTKATHHGTWLHFAMSW